MHRLSCLMTPMMLALAMGPVHAADPAPDTELLLVGRTNIFCVQAPCPWRGIARADDARNGPAGLLWSGEALPRLEAGAEEGARIAAAWEDNECVAVEGRLGGSILYVERVVGACP